VFLWAVVAAVVTVGLTAVLVHLSDGADPQRLAGLLDIVRIGLSVGVGTGGLFALWLATRRQRSAEQTLALQRESSSSTVVDSTERRITDQYTKAIEQLGHEKAAVRLGAVYSLERLAQEHARHRQTVVDVFCSYLRLPFELPADRGERTKSRAGLPSADAAALAELEVRYTIQSTLWEHLGDPEQREMGEKRWSDIDLDLSRTTLVDPILRHLAVRNFKCEHLVVHGIADFSNLRVTGTAGLFHSRFHDRAFFMGSVFARRPVVGDCVFEAGFDLSGSTVPDALRLYDCHFRGEVDLSCDSISSLLLNECKFDQDLALRGTMSSLFVFHSSFEGVFVTEELDVSVGLILGSSFRTPPEKHPKIVVADDADGSVSIARSFAAHFGVDLDRVR
jgi:hypothetical protein